MDESPFDKLSAEIRNHIYEFALTFDEPVCINDHSAIQPPLTRTCKQIRGESLLLFYNLNDFEAYITADQFASSGADVEFQNSIVKITGWADKTSTECHDQVASLRLYLMTGRNWYFNFIEGSWIPRKRVLGELRDELRRRGYENGRVVLRVEIQHTSPISARGDFIRRFFQETGFTVQTLRHRYFEGMVRILEWAE